MYKRAFAACVKSGNAVYLEEPQYVDEEGNTVEDEALGFGYKANIRYTRPENIFVLDETGGNSGGRNDKNNAGEKLVCPTGITPRQEVGIKDEHFTVLPITNLLGELVMVAIIFKGEKLLESWCLGLDVFADEVGFRRGKRYPGGPTCIVNGKEIPCVFAATPNASITTEVLADIFKEIDVRGISYRDEAAGIHPAALVDGHISRVGVPVLAYWNGVDLEAKEIQENPKPRWTVVLGQSYATNVWQPNDEQCSNGLFKSRLFSEKQAFIDKKQAIGLPGEIEKSEIVLVLKNAIEQTFDQPTYAKKSIKNTGWNPPTMVPLDEPSILQSAPEEVRKERTELIIKRGGDVSTDGSNALIMPSERDLLQEGSGLMAGAAAVAEAAAVLNYGGGTAANLFKMSQTIAKRNEGRQRHMNELEVEGELDVETLKKRYEEAKRMTANIIVASGTGVCDIHAFHEILRRQKDRDEKEAATKRKKQAAVVSLQAKAEAVKQKLADNNNDETRLNVSDLKTLFRFQKKKGDPPIPTKKSDLLVRFNQLKNSIAPSTQASNKNRDDEQSSDASDSEEYDSEESSGDEEDVSESESDED